MKQLRVKLIAQSIAHGNSDAANLFTRHDLPNGYYGLYMLAYIPWLWYKVMDKRVLALPQINGDLDKVNIEPARRAEIYAKYGHFQHAALAG